VRERIRHLPHRRFRFIAPSSKLTLDLFQRPCLGFRKALEHEQEPREADGGLGLGCSGGAERPF